jgi:hypothetical protein
MSEPINIRLLKPTPEEGRMNNRSGVTKDCFDVARGGVQKVRLLPSFILMAFEIEAWGERYTPNKAVTRNASVMEWITSKFPYGIDMTVPALWLLLDAAEQHFDPEVRQKAVQAKLKLDEALQRPDGNATGINQHNSGTVDNIHGSSPKADRPTGTSAQAGLRRLRKAAANDDRAAGLLQDITSGKTSVHRACVEMGWRKPPPSPLEAAKRAIRRLIDADPEAVLLVDELMPGRQENPTGANQHLLLESAKSVWLRMSEDERNGFREWAGLKAQP